MNEIKIKICVGTTCFIMGGADMFDKLQDDLSEELLKHIDISLSHCLGECSSGKHGHSPYVLVGDTLISAATFDKVKTEIIKQLEG
jgi:NADH:ubiquinone oxidoreductase subunit E